MFGKKNSPGLPLARKPLQVFLASISLLTIPFVEANPNASLSSPTTSDSCQTSTEVPSASTRELVLIDAGVSDYATLLDDLFADFDRDSSSSLSAETPITVRTGDREVDIYVIDAQNMLAEVTRILSDKKSLNAIHVISHGDTGVLKLGSSTLNSATLSFHEDALRGWGSALAPEGDLMLYGCRVGQNDSGLDFITKIAEITGADIASSIDDTGSEEKGGNWQLEARYGVIETASLKVDEAAAAWQGVLAGGLAVTDLSSTTDTAVANTLLATGVSGIVIDAVSHVGTNPQIGTFTNGATEMPGVVTFEKGIVLATGEAASIDGGAGTGQNTSGSISLGPNVVNTDPELATVIPDPVGYDSAIEC